MRGVVVRGRCNFRLPKDDPRHCKGDCCHYCGEGYYGSDVYEIVRYTSYRSLFEFFKWLSYTGVFKTGERYWSDSFRNPKGLEGGCRYQNPDGSCSLHSMDEREGYTSNPDYYLTREGKYHKPPACRRFPSGEEDFIELILYNLDLKVGDKYSLARIWPKCGYWLEVVEVS